MRMRRAALAVAVVAGGLMPAAPAQARAFTCPDKQAVAAQVSKAQPYEDKMFAPDRLAPFATGAGVRVAVIDSGVDADHPQLRGQVDSGRDFLHGNPDGRQDCVGHGTGVASIIAARHVDSAGLRGLAPDATIVPVRVSEQTDTERPGGSDPVDPGRFADAIDWAASPSGGNADVINMSLVMTDPSDQVRSAVERAAERGVVIVAAAGNRGGADAGNPTPFPASYPGVIGVGAIDAGGARAGFSQRGDYVDVMAPGVDITVAARRGGHTSAQGTSYAAPFVSATAALVKQRFPTATPAQVARRILATTDPAPGGARSDEYGFGVLNPYRALTETLGPEKPAAPAPKVVVTDDPAAVALKARRARAQDLSLMVAAAGAGAMVLVIMLAAALRHGRRRGWRPPTPPPPGGG
ncbi:type VII secretion-associated serine protease mycosin [Couchioplanes caeruleus]|uniref:Type VII secretion-associated serine protease mycosin n=2 Tax=Couchioplanes caeruleus TaxID=56438 RepID=A0A1K0FCS1_9ACTN|nr:type VII secretion-associated serine protease mycosin [Couchioplanes caeruleus]OJF10629.1 type VII secretion-associated serine protease mycosin [Couchioplanes caeruleus subsp. caeruleus]ROP27597.1 type VII secretion-associated serine protease mycosin [Couchioplanes caeruleus]